MEIEFDPATAPSELTPDQFLEVDFLSAKTSQADLHWLPIAKVEPEHQNAAATSVAGTGEARQFEDLKVPVPAINLIQISAMVDQSSKPLQRLLRLSPGLLLFGLAGFNSRFNRSPNSTKEFVTWCQANLIRSLAEIEFVPAVGDLPEPIQLQTEKRLTYSKLNAFFKKHLAAQCNQKLRRSLRRFVTSVTDLDKQQSKQIVNRLVGESLSPNKLKCKRRKRIETLWAVIDDWTKPAIAVEVSQLIKNSLGVIEGSGDFESRLLEEKMASMKQLAYGASHEINNPLANISTRAQTLLSVEQDPEKRNKLAVIYEQAIRAHEMISDMMLFAHPPAIELEMVSVRTLIRKILSELEPALAANPSVDLRVTVGAGVERIEVDVNQFCVALKNLIQNSIEAIASSGKPVVQFKGQVEVRFEESESGLEVSVWDNGQKIIGAVRRHLFDPFYSGREAGRGLGFGLSKVWAIAKLHGGSIEFDDQVKSGTRFVLRLPQQSGVVVSQGAAEVEIEAVPKKNSEAVASDGKAASREVQKSPEASGRDEDAA